MNALKLIQKPKNRQLVINLPEEFANTELEIIILLVHDTRKGNTSSLQPVQNENLAVAKSFFGIAKSDITFGEVDFYIQ